MSCLLGAAACGSIKNAMPQKSTSPKQTAPFEPTELLPDSQSLSPEEQADCPDGQCPDKENCPDGNCPSGDENTESPDEKKPAKPFLEKIPAHNKKLRRKRLPICPVPTPTPQPQPQPVK